MHIGYVFAVRGKTHKIHAEREKHVESAQRARLTKDKKKYKYNRYSTANFLLTRNARSTRFQGHRTEVVVLVEANLCVGMMFYPWVNNTWYLVSTYARNRAGG